MVQFLLLPSPGQPPGQSRSSGTGVGNFSSGLVPWVGILGLLLFIEQVERIGQLKRKKIKTMLQSCHKLIQNFIHVATVRHRADSEMRRMRTEDAEESHYKKGRIKDRWDPGANF